MGAGTSAWWYSNSTQGWVYCSNYMWEPGDQAGSSAAAAGSYAVIGAPTYGTTSSLSWNGYPQKPTVWYDDGVFFNQVGLMKGRAGPPGQPSWFAAGDPSGEADWSQTQGSGAVYVLGF